jgi:N-acetylglucosaminyl-diphospho-decaprenol L-rhamnosyltransferase
VNGSPSAPIVAAIVVNWNGGRDTVRAVRSLLASGYPALRIVLVDNGSRPADLAAVRAECPRVEFLELAENHGFGRAVNLAARTAFGLGAEYLLLFNNDALLPAGVPVIESLVDELKRSAAVGAAGPVIVDDDDRLVVQAAGIALRPSFPAPRGLGRGLPYAAAGKQTFRFDFLQGSCLLVRGSAFRQLGGFDPDFFFYAEDADFVMRLRAAGFETVLSSDVYVRHRKSASIVAGSVNQTYASVRSLLIFFKKHARRRDLVPGAATLIGMSFVFALARRQPLPVARAWVDFLTGRWGGHYR